MELKGASEGVRGSAKEKGESEVMEMEKCVVRRDGARDLAFEGTVLATASSRRQYGKDNTRWTEMTLYRLKSGKYVLAVVGRTLWQGEIDRHAGTVCETPQAVLAAMTQDDGYLSGLAKATLAEAAEADPGFAAILLEEVE